MSDATADTPPPMDITNRQLVGISGERPVVVIVLPAQVMSPRQALVHAAWLVAVAEHSADVSFDEVLAAVRNS